jgi:hypothetical protein
MQVVGKIGIYSTPQVLCFSNVNHSVLRISPAIYPRAGGDFCWFVCNLHESYLLEDFPAATFFAGTCFTALVAFLGVTDASFFVALVAKSGLRNLAV